MTSSSGPTRTSDLPAFSRDMQTEQGRLSAIGGGFIGGKATGLLEAQALLQKAFPEGASHDIRIDVPALVVIGTEVFETFLERGDLGEVLDDGGLSDERISHAFLRADFPSEVLGHLRALAVASRSPLAIRSSSLLEDATHEPFAGIYLTKMIPNNQPDADTRFRKLIEAVKLVWASTFFREARGYRRMAHRDAGEEQMAVIVQEVVGLRHQDRFYPTISGVGRTWNWYPSGPARPEQGVVQLALGLGRQIVDGGKCWSYSPAHPRVPPPYTTRDMLQQTQTSFWAVNMGRPPAYDPTRETEYLENADLAAAEMDGSLAFVASTYDAAGDRIVMGIGRPGPRVLNFDEILTMPGAKLREVIREVLDVCRGESGEDVEVEFAVTVDPLRRDPTRLGLLQVRPIVVERDVVDIPPDARVGDRVLVGSDKVLGNGIRDQITDIVYVRPDVFDKSKTRLIAAEVAKMNAALAAEGRECILIVFGRIGSTEPWLGIPVDWGQISQAKVIVEATTPEMNVDLSQGSHFFHNVTNLQIPFFTVRHDGSGVIRWNLLDASAVVQETEHVRHVRLDAPATVRVDGRHGLGIIELL